MNLLEHYIQEVHSVKKCPDIQIKGEECVEVDVTINCWGSIERVTTVMGKRRWEQSLKDGYYMA